MKIVVFGYHAIGYRCLEELLEQGQEVIALFTHTKDRNENIWYDTPDKLAKAHNIPCYYQERLNLPHNIDFIKSLNPDIIFSFYYRKMICQEILDIPPMGAINLHGSYLPRYRGRCPVNWVIINGEKETGVTLHYMIEKPDAGDIIAQRRVGIDKKDTAYDLFQKMIKESVLLLREAWPGIQEGTNPRIPQNEDQATYFENRKPSDGLINWENSTESIYNLIRAVTKPYPGAFTYFRGKKLYIWESEMEDTKNFMSNRPPGQMFAISGDLYIAASDGILKIVRCQKESQKECSGQKFITLENITKENPEQKL